MMYIKKIIINNIRCFEKAEIDFGQPGTSLLIAGNNGSGKSAILRSIAMGLCDRDSAASLLRELEGNFVRKGAKKPIALIDIEMHDEETRITWTIKTKVSEWEKSIIESVEQLCAKGLKKTPVKYTQFPWHKIFVVAYGAGLRTTATAKFSEYFAPDAVYPLFKYDAPLQDPELAWRRLIAAAEKKGGKRLANNISQRISNLLKGVLGLSPNAKIILEPNGIFLKEKNKFIELNALGDGHKAVAKVVLDLVVWYLLLQSYDAKGRGEEREWRGIQLEEDGKLQTIFGIVIIDEIEQHLHPKLQRQIINNLSEKFPNIQFIMSTHSPLCVAGTADVTINSKEAYKIYSVYKDKDEKPCIKEMPVPHGLRADQILVDYFDLETTLPISLQAKVNKYRTLVMKEIDGKLSPQDKKEYVRLELELRRSAPLVAEREDDRKIELQMMQTTKKMEKMLLTKKPIL